MSVILRYFEHPLWLAIALAGGMMLCVMAWRAGRIRQQSCDRLRIKFVSKPRTKLVTVAAALCLFSVAAAGPRWRNLAMTETAHVADVAIVIDASRSMLAMDAMPNRLDRARELAGKVVESLAAQGGYRITVVAFAANAMTIAPLTYDTSFALYSLKEFEVADLRSVKAVSGTRIGAGIDEAIHALGAGGSESRMILLFSDGDDPANDNEWLQGTDAAALAHIPVAVVGIGDANRDSAVPDRDATTRLRDGPLREIAIRTGGKYLGVGIGQADVTGFVRTMIADLPKTNEPDQVIGRAPAQTAPFLAAGLATLMLAFVGWSKRTMAVSAGLVAIAAGPVDDWLRRGDAALVAGDAKQSLHWYEKTEGRAPDPGLVAFNEGVALAALGRYREAELHFRWCLSDAEGPRRARALYNIGTCLARRSAGRDRQSLQAAIEAYSSVEACACCDHALIESVQTNLAIARELLAQAPPEDKSKNGPNDPTEERDDSAHSTKEGSGKGDETVSSSAAPGSDATTGDNPRMTDKPGPPGKGTLPPLVDDSHSASMTVQDFEEHMRRAMERITAARSERLRAKGNEQPREFPDW